MKELIGKTIKNIEISPREGYDDVPFLDIEFDDGTSVRFMATSGGYTGNSFDEYPMEIVKL